MKKLPIILAGVLQLALGFSRAQAQDLPKTGAQLNFYGLSMQQGTYHDLGSGASILFQPTQDTLINHKFIVKQDSLVPIAVGEAGMFGTTFNPAPQKHPSCIELPAEMMFGTTKVNHVGITTDGFLFFGDTVIPAFNGGKNSAIFYLVTSGAKTKNFVYFTVADATADGQYDKETPLYANSNSKIGYETNGDTLWIGYENIIIKESASQQVVSWNYRINVKTGDISLQTKGFYNSSDNTYPNRKFAYGLVGLSQKETNWLRGFKTPANTNDESSLYCTVGKDSLTEGASYTFTMPEACQAIDANVTFKLSSTANQISLNGTTWARTTRALFVLSSNKTLEDSEKPQDGVDYTTSYTGACTVGTGKVPGLWAEIVNGSVAGLTTPFRNLTADSKYYIHAYTYNNNCSDGPLYGLAKIDSIYTSMATPDGTDISLVEATKSSLKFTLPETGNNDLNYMVAISENSLGSAQNLLENGRSYAIGDAVGTAEIKLVNVGSGEHIIENLKSATIYRISIWYSRGTGSSISYSSGFFEMTAQTLFVAPVTLSFSNDELYSKPVGWAFFSPESAWVVSTYGQEEGGFGAKAPAAGTKILYNQLFDNRDDDEPTYPTTLYDFAISPQINKGDINDISATFNVGFYTTNMWSGAMSAYKLKEGDSVIISWADNQDASQWNRLYVVNSNTSLDKEGFASVSVPAFTPTDNFCFKIELYHSASTWDDVIGFAIESIETEEDLPCKFPVNIAAAQEDITYSSAIVKWEDGNPDGAWAESFNVKYRAENESDWQQKTTTETEISLSGLRPATSYVVCVQAVCGDNGNSLEKTAGFSTSFVLEIPYSYNVLESFDMPKGSEQWRGIPGDDLVEIAETDFPNGWNINSDATYNIAMLNNLDINTNTWLILPSLLPANTGNVNFQLKMSAFGLDETYSPIDASRHSDSLFVFVSSTGNFKTDRQLVGAVPLDSLYYELQDDGMLYYTFDMQFAVEAEKLYNVALYVPGKGAVSIDEYEGSLLNQLVIRSIDMTYANIEYPAVSNIQTDNLSSEGFRVSWEGEADSYKVLLKEHLAETDYNEVETEEKSYTFTGLKPGTRYAFKVYGIYGGFDGKISEEQYITTLQESADPDTVKTPTFTPGSGAVNKGTVVRIECDTKEVQIYYTTDGSIPTTQSQRYTFGITVDTAMTIKALAVKDGMIDSKVAEASYTVNVSNEDNEVAGLRIYPNPNDGRFNVSVPANGTLEVFAANGHMVYRSDISAGTTTLQLDNAGIYFLRVRVNEQVSIRKVVVR